MASLSINKDDLVDAYLAGLFDGEGSVSITGHPHTTLTLALAMTTSAPFPLLVERFGGRWYLANRRTVTGRQVYRWDVVGTSAKRAVRTLLSKCVVKVPQLRLANELIELLEAQKQRLGRVYAGHGRKLQPYEAELRNVIAITNRQLNGTI